MPLPRNVLLPLLLAACAVAEEPAPAPPPHTLTGQLLLPPGDGPRGIEVVATVRSADGQHQQTWILFDDAGRFTHELSAPLTELAVSASLRAELLTLDAPALPAPSGEGVLDVGTLDLRDRLASHTLTLTAGQTAAPGEVRMALCFGLPPTGPQGGRVALGSRQFPSRALDSQATWLLPHTAGEIYFLTERPGQDGAWLGGEQQLFGPYTLDSLPDELVVGPPTTETP